jgi:hypothetical protein
LLNHPGVDTRSLELIGGYVGQRDSAAVVNDRRICREVIVGARGRKLAAVSAELVKDAG